MIVQRSLYAACALALMVPGFVHSASRRKPSKVIKTNDFNDHAYFAKKNKEFKAALASKDFEYANTLLSELQAYNERSGQGRAGELQTWSQQYTNAVAADKKEKASSRARAGMAGKPMAKRTRDGEGTTGTYALPPAYEETFTEIEGSTTGDRG